MIKISHSQEVKIIEKAFVDAFEEVDKAYLITARKKEMKDGSTGLVALVSHGYEVPVAPTTAASLWPPERNAAQKQPGTVGRAPGGVAKLFLAWCGDSRCVLLRGRQGLRVTEDHRPNRRDEQSRIKAAGGKIAQDSHGIWRVGPREENRYAKELEKNKKKNSAHMKMYLSTSRSFGDIGLKAPDPIVTATPDVKVVDLTPDDWAVMMGCDGIFDVLSDQEVANVLFKAMVSDGLDPVGAAKAVVQAAFKSGSRDNLTAIVMRLGWSLPPTSTTETPSYLPAAVAEAAAATAEVKKDEFDMFG
jgi:protein phosphatase 1L